MVKFDVLQLAVHFFDLADIDVLHNVARHRVNADRPARTDPFQAFGRFGKLFGVGAAVGFLQHFGNQAHAVIAADRHEVWPVFRIGFVIGLCVGFVFWRFVGLGVVKRRDQAERRIANCFQDVLVRQIAGGNQLDACLAQSAFLEAFHEGNGFAAGWQEQEHGIGLGVLDLLQEGREIRVFDRCAHFTDDLAASGSEGLFELAFGIVAGAVVGDQGEDFLDLVLGGPAGNRGRVLR